MDSNWHYAILGEGACGPISKTELGRILRAKVDAPEVLVWCPGMTDWARASHVPALKEFFRNPPSVPSPFDHRNAALDRPWINARTAQSAVGIESFHNEVGVREEPSATSATHPWARYFARLLDTFAFSILFFFFLGILFPSLFNQAAGKETEKSLENLYGIVALLAYVPFEAFCMNIFGTTVSKALYGIRVTNNSGERLDLATALKRSFAVWVRGWGLGIPIVSIFTLITAYRTLRRDGITSWDSDLHCTVSYDEFSYLRLFLLIFMWAVLISLWAYLVSLG